MNRNVLIMSHDSVGRSMAGTGIRYWEIAHALAKEFAVTLAAPQPIDLPTDFVVCRSYRWGDEASLAPLLQDVDVVVAGGHVLEGHPQLAHIRQPLVVDLSDPTMLENMELFRHAPAEQRGQQYQHDRQLLQQQLAAGDFFVCATERQRDLYLGALLLHGRTAPFLSDGDPQLRGLLDVVSSGVPDEPPVGREAVLRAAFPAIGAHDPLLLWNGGLWDWMDPLTLVDAMPQVVAHHPQVRLVFLAGQHPGNAHPMRMPALAKARAADYQLLNRSIFFYERWIPYQQRGDVLLEADIALSLHHDHLETSYAALRSRILDQLWAGLPAVVSGGDEAARLLHAAEAGLVVPPGDSARVAEALLRLLDDVALRRAQAQAASQLAQQFCWSRVVAPLAHFCQQPRRTRNVGKAVGEVRAGFTAKVQRAQRSGQEMVCPSRVLGEETAGRGLPGGQTAGSKPMQRDGESSSAGFSSPASHAKGETKGGGRQALLEACRNAALAVQEQAWRLQEQPLTAGRFPRVRRFVIDQFVRPFVAPLLAQQQRYNAAVLRSLYAMNELQDEDRRVLAHVHAQQAETVEHVAGLEEADTQLLRMLTEQRIQEDG